MPTVYIVDDDDAVLQSLRWLIESIHVPVVTFSSAEDFLKAYRTNMQGCLVTDVYLNDMNGLELQEQLIKRGSSLAVIVMTGYGDVPMAVRAMKSGAFDFFVKPFNEQALLECVQAGLASSTKQHVQKQNESVFLGQLNKLTSREKQVMDLVASGARNKVIAQQLDISLKTVELHKHNMMKKMQMPSVAELIRQLVTLELQS